MRFFASGTLEHIKVSCVLRKAQNQRFQGQCERECRGGQENMHVFKGFYTPASLCNEFI